MANSERVSNVEDSLNNDDNDENIIINELDGLPNVHPNLETDMDLNLGSSDHTPNEFEDIPTSLIVTNIHDDVFGNEKQKAQMEDLFKKYGEPCTFQWLRSFRRLRVNYTTPVAAANARLQLHQYSFLNSIITCYFAQPVTPITNKNLELPAPVKQFLISPPSSPPLGWEPRPENEPLVNHDLLAALASLAPGGSHELHPPGPGQPGIVVHTAGNRGDAKDDVKQKIQQTRCPERV